MKNFAGGFLLGALLVSAIAWFFVIPQTRASYKAVGYNDGQIYARWKIADQVSNLLGDDLLTSESKDLLFNVKSRSVVIVERNGVKTLRTIK
ncbi:hypothetical protein [Thermomonas mangrovi]|uniref:hypothetical protein n=1 Tax=Thermomonas mangrovi TaxID=2993316 RepID=UPI0023080537|nr:hypothetical protein [Thermomonas mangrovi]